ncbi:hypothetical protein O3P69_011936 [Scylla paramamosain]|uniref:Uncharacterized protein n=1 Tax=Scylla paramamosain TaxID=85552 RepID=A0AAW0SF56_SCYPA
MKGEWEALTVRNEVEGSETEVAGEDTPGSDVRKEQAELGEEKQDCEERRVATRQAVGCASRVQESSSVQYLVWLGRQVNPLVPLANQVVDRPEHNTEGKKDLASDRKKKKTYIAYLAPWAGRSIGTISDLPSLEDLLGGFQDPSLAFKALKHTKRQFLRFFRLGTVGGIGVAAVKIKNTCRPTMSTNRLNYMEVHRIFLCTRHRLRAYSSRTFMAFSVG